MALIPVPASMRSVAPATNAKLSLLLKLAVACLVMSGVQLQAQIQAPSNPDNVISLTDPIGTPPGVATDGTSESVNLTNGSLTTYIPILSVPQRGGWTLPFAFIHSSNNEHLKTTLTTQSNPTNDNNNIWYDVLTYHVGMASDGLFNLNLPRLKASLEYAGDYTWYLGGNTQYQIGMMGGIV